MLVFQSLPSLQRRLQVVSAAIEAHPMSSETFQRAQAVITAHGNDDDALIERELAEQNLPKVTDLGRQVFQGAVSFARLHRERFKLEKRIAKLSQ